MRNLLHKKMVTETGTGIYVDGDVCTGRVPVGNTGEKHDGDLLKPLEYLGNCLLGLCFASVCLLFILMLLGIVPRIVISGSMEPEIRVGSLTFINTNDKIGEVQTGDIIAYKVDEKLQVAHRVIEITPEGIRTKGDCNDEADSLMITEKEFLGKVVFTIPLLGYLFAFLKTPLGIVLTLAFMVILFLTIGVYRKIKYS